MSLLTSILFKVTITTALALCCAWFARQRRAAVRHVVLAAAFAVLLVLPLVAVVAPSIRVSLPVSAQIIAASPFVDVPAGPTGDAPPADTPGYTAAPATRVRGLSSGEFVFGVWALGAAVFLLPMAIGCAQLRSLRRKGLPWTHGRGVVDALALDTGIRRRVHVLLHASVPGPMTCGMLRPVILLPTDAGTWHDDDLRRALLHELAHVRRGDWVIQCIARLVAACYWFHPMVWVAWRQLSLEAERACDDAVLDRSDAAAYADQLVLLAQRLSASANHPQLAMASRHDLAARVAAVLDSRQPRGRAGAAWVGAACAVSVLLIATVSPLRVVAAARAPQAQAAGTSAPARFEAASIKRCPPEEQVLGRARGTAGGTNASASPGRFTVPCVTLEQLIYLAYASYGARPEERLENDYMGTASDDTKVRGGPSWVHSYKDKYAIEATAPGVTDRFVLMGTMLRTLLEERFQLKVHRESEGAPMYALRVAKGGFKLKPMKEGDCEQVSGPPPWTGKPCGFMTRSTGTMSNWHFVGFTIGFLARQLADPLGRHVIDETGISGDYLLNLVFAPDSAATGADDSTAAAPPVAGVSLFTALEEQMGLKLDPIKGTRGFLVIDRAERPTPDLPSPDAPYGRGVGKGPARAAGAGPAGTSR